MLRIEMLSTGDEVLHGQIVDSNSAWLADYLFEQGLPMHYRTTVGDDLSRLVKTLQERSQQCDVLIVNGGLGPTSDDLSTLAAATALGEKLVEHAEWMVKIEAYFASSGRAMAASNRKQALLPASATIIDNPIGTACGFIITMNHCQIFFTPGVPLEFQKMVQQHIVPRLHQQYSTVEPLLCWRLTTFGRTESSLATQLANLSIPKGIQLGYRSSMPIIELKLTGSAALQNEMGAIWQQVRQQVNKNTIFEGTAGLAAWLSQQLKQRQLKVAISEQFSAGLLFWQLNSAGAALTCGEILSEEEICNITIVTDRARKLANRSGADIVLVIGKLEQNHLSVALYSPQESDIEGKKCHAITVQYRSHHHNVQIRQQIAVILLQDMLRRWLNSESVYGEYEWLAMINKEHF